MLKNPLQALLAATGANPSRKNIVIGLSGDNLRGLFDFDSAQPERSKTKSIDVTRHSFFMGVIPFFNHSGLATSVYEKGCAPANFPQESACSLA